jgi:integrase
LLKVGHIDVVEGYVVQNGAELRTKFSKSFMIWFLPVERMYEDCLSNWIKELIEKHRFGPNDPLFPKPQIKACRTEGYQNVGLSREHYKSNDQRRKFITAPFSAAGLPPFTRHRFRNTVVAMETRFIKTPERLKAVSMNFGHSSVQMTVDGYDQNSPQRQGEVIKALRKNIRPAQEKS